MNEHLDPVDDEARRWRRIEQVLDAACDGYAEVLGLEAAAAGEGETAAARDRVYRRLAGLSHADLVWAVSLLLRADAWDRYLVLSEAERAVEAAR